MNPQTASQPNTSKQTTASKPASGQVREIPVREDVLKRSAAQELADPPRFPPLK